jgi:lipopolysaccharide/colanic/teichoic acid biosynthesis glycosyltransferase
MGQPVTHVSDNRRYGSHGASAERKPAKGGVGALEGAAPMLQLAVDAVPPVEEHLGRRALNVSVAAIGIVSAAPIMLAVAALVRFTSRGPVIYTQTRVGLDQRTPGDGSSNRRRAKDIGGKPFLIYKFRTMHVDAEAKSGAVWATPSDPRLTVVGGFLRQYRLDELPQLFNVLKGDMNIVGPRPERPQLFETLKESVEHYQLRQRAKPGITGLAQISQQYDSCLGDVQRKVQYDMEYLRRRSLAQDIKIMLKTVPVVLFRKGGW